jgi:non-homologous end joining protein Ku
MAACAQCGLNGSPEMLRQHVCGDNEPQSQVIDLMEALRASLRKPRERATPTPEREDASK